MLKPRCLTYGQKFKRITKVVKYKLNAYKMDYKFRVKPAFTLLLRGIISDDNYQPDRLIYSTNKV
jgi:hypothetical protein